MTRLIRPGMAGGISRRGILKGSAALGAAAMLAPLGASRALAQSTPKQGGTLRIGIAAGNTSDTVDPAVAEHVYTHMLLHAYNAYLTVVMPDGTLEGRGRRGLGVDARRQDLDLPAAAGRAVPRRRGP